MIALPTNGLIRAQAYTRQNAVQPPKNAKRSPRSPLGQTHKQYRRWLKKNRAAQKRVENIYDEMHRQHPTLVAQAIADVPDPTTKDSFCPKCGVSGNQPCVTAGGAVARHSHSVRPA